MFTFLFICFASFSSSFPTIPFSNHLFSVYSPLWYSSLLLLLLLFCLHHLLLFRTKYKVYNKHTSLRRCSTLYTFDLLAGARAPISRRFCSSHRSFLFSFLFLCKFIFTFVGLRFFGATTHTQTQNDWSFQQIGKIGCIVNETKRKARKKDSIRERFCSNFPFKLNEFMYLM